jgi:Predicted nucleotide-binding protein containing TIR-like domain
MSKPKLFIGSSKKNLRVAKVLAEGLEEYAEVRVWDEGVFGLNQGFLEALLKKLEDYDFAVFILAPDDMIISNEETKPSPRDNVLFESGLFMGVLGRARVFLVYDQVVGLKIPSDLAGVTLASYDSTRIQGEDAAASVRKACRVIGDSITAARFPHLIGEWKSIYLKTDEEGQPLVEEEVEIRACRNGISIGSKCGTREDDYYMAFGRVPQERQIIGEWKSRAESCDTSGVFVLTVSPGANYMYGYFTSPDEIGGTVYASWVLAKKANIDEAKINERLKTAQNMLRKTTIGLTPQSSDS